MSYLALELGVFTLKMAKKWCVIQNGLRWHSNQEWGSIGLDTESLS